MTSQRIAAVLVPEFPVALLIRDHPDYTGRPAVVAEYDEGVAPVLAANHLAASIGAQVGVNLAQAKMLVDNLVVGFHDEGKETTASSRLINSLQKISPFVEEDLPGTYFVQVSGMMLLYQTEHRFARAVIDTVAAHQFPVAIGIAANKYVATVAAAVAESHANQGREPIVIVPDCHEKDFLRDLSIDYLPVSPETRDKLRLLGIRKIGQAARFAGNELISRFGDDGIMLARLSHGDDTRPLLAGIPPEELTASRSFLTPLDNVSTLLFHVGELLTDLLTRLEPQSQGCACVDLELVCENHEAGDKTKLPLSLAIDTPSLATKPFLQQLRHQLASIQLTGGITDLSVTIPNAVDLLGEQIDFARIQTAKTSPAKLTVAAHDQQIFIPHLLTASLPEQSFRLLPCDQRPPKKDRKKSIVPHTPLPGVAYTGRSLSGLRLFQPVRPTTVTTDQHGSIQHLTIDRRPRPVVAINGPWLLSGHWWQHPFERTYYELETTERKVYLVFAHPADNPKWFIQGVFD